MDKKIANILFAACFLLFIVVGAAVTIMRPKDTTSYFENRTLAPIPEYSVSVVLDASWFSQWETYLQDHSAARNTLLKVKTYTDLSLLHRPVVNDVVVTDGLLLGFNAFETPDSRELAMQSDRMADSMQAFGEVVARAGGTFYYVAVPGQYTYFADRYPVYLNSRKTFTSYELAAFKKSMAERGVPLIDMSDTFAALGHPDSFFSTCDYHYTFYGAFETYRTIMQRIRADVYPSLDMLTENDLTFNILDNPYLGSRGRKLYGLVSTGEKAVIGIPNNPVPYTRTDNGDDTEPSVYALPTHSWETVSYTLYMGGDVAETVIETHRPELPNILIVGDSFTNPVESLLYLSFNEMRSVDLRQYDQMSLARYVEEYKPDIVVMLRDYEVLLSADGNGSVI